MTMKRRMSPSRRRALVEAMRKQADSGAAYWQGASPMIAAVSPAVGGLIGAGLGYTSRGRIGDRQRLARARREAAIRGALVGSTVGLMGGATFDVLRYLYDFVQAGRQLAAMRAAMASGNGFPKSDMSDLFNKVTAALSVPLSQRIAQLVTLPFSFERGQSADSGK